MLYKKQPKLLNQFQYCENHHVPFVVILGEEEKKNGGVKIKDVTTKQEVICCVLRTDQWFTCATSHHRILSRWRIWCLSYRRGYLTNHHN